MQWKPGVWISMVQLWEVSGQMERQNYNCYSTRLALCAVLSRVKIKLLWTKMQRRHGISYLRHLFSRLTGCATEWLCVGLSYPLVIDGCGSTTTYSRLIASWQEEGRGHWTSSLLPAKFILSENSEFSYTKIFFQKYKIWGWKSPILVDLGAKLKFWAPISSVENMQLSVRKLNKIATYCTSPSNPYSPPPRTWRWWPLTTQSINQSKHISIAPYVASRENQRRRGDLAAYNHARLSIGCRRCCEY